jgi:molecular chaperone GrpE (heat shock protein)
LILISWNAAPRSQAQFFDAKKSQQELEIMKGILRTTLDFAAKELQGGGGEDRHNGPAIEFGGFSNISAFYLYGQGAVFTIPTSSMRHSFNFHFEGLKGSLDGLQGSVAALAGPQDVNIEVSNLDEKIQEELDHAHEEVERAQEEMERAQQQMERAREREQRSNAPGLAAVPAPAAPAAPQAPPTPPASPKPPRTTTARTGLSPERKEQLRKRLAEAQEKVKKRQEELERSRAKFREQLAEIKIYLIEALANHGDSLSVVKPNEYINLIMAEESGDAFFSGDSRSRREIISVQKSVIADYKAGRITLEVFKQRVLDYNN